MTYPDLHFDKLTRTWHNQDMAGDSSADDDDDSLIVSHLDVIDQTEAAELHETR